MALAKSTCLMRLKGKIPPLPAVQLGNTCFLLQESGLTHVQEYCGATMFTRHRCESIFLKLSEKQPYTSR